MKHSIKILLAAVIISACFPMMNAQNVQDGNKQHMSREQLAESQSKQRKSRERLAEAQGKLRKSRERLAESQSKQHMSREQLAEAQGKHIASKLGLDDATAKKYVDAFCDYQKEIWALGPKTHGKKKADMTDAETDQEIKARFERSEKILAIRQKYYKRYREFLMPKQIERAYKLENEAMKQLSRNARNQKRIERQKAHSRRVKKRNAN